MQAGLPAPPAHAHLPPATCPPACRGQRLVDAAVFEPVPFRSAIADGGTHLLVLCTRPRATRRSRVNMALADAMESAIKKAILSPDYMVPAWKVSRGGRGAVRPAEAAPMHAVCCALLCAVCRERVPARGVSCAVCVGMGVGPTCSGRPSHRQRLAASALALRSSSLLPFLLSSFPVQAEVDYLMADGLSQDDMLLKAATEEEAHKLPWFAGTHVYPLYPGAAAK